MTQQNTSNSNATWQKSLKGRVIMITGGASGIGYAAALMAARDGATVYALDRNEQLLAGLSAHAASEGLAIHTHACEVTDAASVEAATQWCVNKLGPMDGLVCSAGITQEIPFLELPLSLWNKVLDVNLTGTFLSSQTAARAMVASGKPGAIVTISSSFGVTVRPGAAAYCASKAGVIALSKTMALELAPHRIRVNCVAPGSVDTPLSRGARAASGRTVSGNEHPLGRQGEPDDIASMICFLLSESASWVTGQTYHVNGGKLLV
jgi:NAD(P)-dependent dehydrogenase (short-subunit alcohol dehydrogenase family)